jgi:hypothetical protein
MDWQQLVSLAIVGAAGILVLRGRLRRGRMDLGRDTACGCCAASHEVSPSSVVFRARKGKRPQVIVKMK